MTPVVPISLEERIAADVFQKSYREFMILKPTNYKWYHLAPQSVSYLAEAQEKQWSTEKIGDYLHCDIEEAEACNRRYQMSKRVNDKATTAGRLHQTFVEWIGEITELDEKTKNILATDLSKRVANQLYSAALSKEDLMSVSLNMEGFPKSAEIQKPLSGQAEAAAKWGPQWKD